MTRRWPRTAVTIAIVLVMVACSNGDENGEDASPTTVAPTTARSPVTVVGKWDRDEQNNFQIVINKFQEMTGHNVRYKSEGDNIARSLDASIQEGSRPDIAILPQPGLLQDLAKRGELKPIGALAGELVEQNYGDPWRQLGTFEDELYGVWFKATNKSTVWYLTKAFAEARLSAPGSWDEFLNVANALRAAGVTPFSVAGAAGWTLTDWFENVYLRSAGPDMYDMLTRGDIPWTHDSVKEALYRLADIFGKARWLADDPLTTSFERSVTQVFGDNPPKAAMVYEGDAVIGVINEQTPSRIGAEADFFGFPAIEGSKPSVLTGGDVAVLLSDNPAAQEFIKFLATPEAAEPWARQGGFASPNRKLSLDVYPSKIAGRAAAAIVTSEVVRFDLSDLQPASFGANPDRGMWKILQEFLAKPGSVDIIAAQLEAAR